MSNNQIKVSREYNATAVNASPCYSNLYDYGAGGQWRSIIPPTPVTVQPAIFNVLRPHRMPQAGLKPSLDQPSHGPYKLLDGLCCSCYQ